MVTLLQNQQHNVVAASPVLTKAKKRSSGWGWLRRLLKRWHIRKRDIALLAAAAVLSVLSAGASVMTLQMLRHIGVLGSAALVRQASSPPQATPQVTCKPLRLPPTETPHGSPGWCCCRQASPSIPVIHMPC